MFRRSVWVVITILSLVFASSFASQMMRTGNLPSAYDTGLRMNDAFKSSETPLLVEFYADSCTTCQMVTPLVHRAYKSDFKDKLTVVMVDTDDPNNAMYTQLFGIDTIPALFVFDPKHMKKEPIPFEALDTPATITEAVNTALGNIETRIATEPQGQRMPPQLR